MEFLAMNAAPSASTILGKLGNAIAEKYTLLGGVGDEIQELKDELESMVACFRDVANDGDENQKEQMRTWMKQVREVSYDAEDCIDMALHLSEDASVGESSTRLARWMHKAATLIRTLKIRNKLAAEIQTLKSRAQNVSDRRLRYKLDAEASQPADQETNVPTTTSDDSSLFGMADNEQQVINFLKDPSENLKVMSIVGSGGLGKTTLAMSVFNKADTSQNNEVTVQNVIENVIERSAFVSVSRTYDRRALLEDIVKQLRLHGEADPSFEDIWVLIRKSREHLETKRYLVILDDVWSSTAWQDLKEAFPDNGKRSRIIITTRNDEVAKHFSSSRYDVLTMEPLSREHSKKLLCKTVFGLEEIPPTHTHVCGDILKKCGGLPLAIVSIGGMLAQRKNEPPSKWKTVIDRLPSELKKGKNLDAMRKIISLSYDDMPYHLKACFLYLSVFPEDYDIRRGPLIRRWEAEGFINEEVHGLSLEEIAKDYFDGFVSRSVVTNEQRSSNGEVRSFQVHDIMLDIITVKSIQENFVSFHGNRKYNRGGHDKIRRLSIHPGSEDTYFCKRGSIRHVRSLTIMGSTPKRMENYFSELKLLRVLDLEGCPWSLSDKHWGEICKLSLLRYLSLRRTATELLPRKLGKLKGLLTLDVRQTKVEHFPKSITQLQNLQHLLAGAYVHYTRTHTVKHFDYKNQEVGVVRIPPGLSKLKALKRISFVDVNGRIEELQEVAKLSQLTRLSVIQTESRYDSNWGGFGDSLSKLRNSLRYLSVMQDQGDNNIAGQLNFLQDVRSPPILLHSLHLLGRIDSLPWWVKDLSSLASLSLRHTYIADISVLERLQSLVSLKLYSGAFTGGTLCFSHGQFQVLKQLVIDNLTNLETLKFEGDGAKNLERLTLYLPVNVPVRTVEGINNLSELKTVELFGTNHDKVVEEVTKQAAENTNKPILTITNQDLRPSSANYIESSQESCN